MSVFVKCLTHGRQATDDNFHYDSRALGQGGHAPTWVVVGVVGGQGCQVSKCAC